MVKLSIKTNAKINIGLNILRKREDDYHELEMIMAPISLADDLEVEFFNSEGNLSLYSPQTYIPVNEDNIIFKIYNKFYEYTKLNKEKIAVYLDKKIPVQAGLGGGSSNGAFFLKMLNNYHDNILSYDELNHLGKSVGADIPFFIENKTALVKGIGEKIEFINNNLECKVLLIKPDFGVSTKKAYDSISSLGNKKYSDLSNIINGLDLNNINKVIENIENTLQQALINSDENIIGFEKRLKEIDIKFFMSGSGSCYFTLLTTDCSDRYYNIAKEKFKDCFVYLCDLLK